MQKLVCKTLHYWLLWVNEFSWSNKYPNLMKRMQVLALSKWDLNLIFLISGIVILNGLLQKNSLIYMFTFLEASLIIFFLAIFVLPLFLCLGVKSTFWGFTNCNNNLHSQTNEILTNVNKNVSWSGADMSTACIKIHWLGSIGRPIKISSGETGMPYYGRHKNKCFILLPLVFSWLLNFLSA